MNNLIKILLFSAILPIFVYGCTNDSDAIRALRDSGYRDISTGGYGWFSCGSDDFYSTKFTATNIHGNKINGVVCSGLIFKGATIRY